MSEPKKHIKGKFKNINIGNLCLAVTLVAIVFAVIFGIITRHSYKVFDNYDEAIVETTDNQSRIDDINYKRIKRQLDKMKYAFVIEVTKSEQTYQRTKTYGTVKKVVKGEQSYVGQDIAIYEACFMDYYDQIDSLFFRSMNSLSIPMVVGKTYLVFGDKIDYAEEYTETLECDEFIVDWGYYMYSFPLDMKIESITYKDGLTYKEIKDKCYICYTQEGADKLEIIKEKILDEYI